MATGIDFTIDVHLDGEAARRTMAEEVRSGLSASPKELPSKYFYDERGSILFEQITDLPEYYLTRAEQSLLEEIADDVAREVEPEELVELGSGSAKKTRLLIEATRSEGALKRYIPVEVSQEMAEHSARGLARTYPDLSIHAVVGDFERHLSEVPTGRRRLVAFLGSTIGNFPMTSAVDFLRQVPALLRRGGYFLLGTDLVKEPSVLEAAYNDSQGVTAEFNKNILNVMNNEFRADFDPDRFSHESFYNPEHQRIETYLRSHERQTASLDDLGLQVDFAAGEKMRTEVSCKYTRNSVEQLLNAAGLGLKHWYTDPGKNFALSLSSPL